MKIILSEKSLQNNEMRAIDEEIKKFPNPVYFSKAHWEEIKEACVAKTNGQIVGICSIARIGNWYKLGPFIVFEKYQGKGIGKMIMQKIVDGNKNKKLFIASRNKKVWKIMESLGFKEETNFWRFPLPVKFYLFKSLLWVFDFKYLQELMRKKSWEEGNYRIFLRSN